jgi:tetratricopeptide (TPR) repeat protein
MTSQARRVSILCFLFLLTGIFLSSFTFSQESASLEEGIGLYKAEKYDQAVNALLKAREEDPKSTTAAFFLGMAYKQLMDYEAATKPLGDAITMTPKIKEALIELIEVNVRLGRTEEANKWIGVAEQEKIEPANTAFLKGLVLLQEGKNREAAASFENAKALDPKIAQASDIQIAMTKVRESELKDAKQSFESAITADPNSDLAGFARQYLAKVEDTLYERRPLRFTLSLFGQYDDNMVLKPSDDDLATGVTDEASLVLNTAFRMSYNPQIKGPFLFSAYYALASGLHKEHSDTHDSLSNTISITPGYNFGKAALNVAATYNYFLVRQPDYEKYSGKLSVGPMLRFAINNNQLLEVFGGYNKDKYYEEVYFDNEVRSSTGISAYGSWVWLFKKNSFLNFRYQYVKQDAEGANWDNVSNSVSGNVVIPAAEKVKLQLSGEYMMKNFDTTHTMFDIKREDRIYNLTASVSWEFYRNLSLIGQITRISNGSNIGIYDYTRNMYTTGLEYRF